MTEGSYLLTNPLGHHFIIVSYEKMMTEGGKVYDAFLSLNPLAHHFMIASYEKMMTEGGKVNTKG